MRTIPKYLATCGQNVTLFCTVTADIDLLIRRFYWMKTRDICYWDKGTNQTDMECATSFNNTVQKVYSFPLTIFNVQPKHEGTYHCKLHAREGMKNNQTVLRVQMCYGSPSSEVTDTELSVRFTNIFPRPRVVWSRGQDDLTHDATTNTNITENSEGTFTVVSTIKRDTSQPLNYNFSLWMSVEQENQTPVEMQVQHINFSGGHMVAMHWFSVLIVMVCGSLVQYCCL